MLTDNKVLVNKLVQLPTLMCAQRKADKRISSEDDFVQSNIDSFGNEIGQTTNYITSMFEVRSHFRKGTDEYEELSYRIRCGQLYQQNAIDKAKGIICKPMPKEWHDRHAANRLDGDKRKFYRSIVADKKPYFMKYIYPSLMKQYNTYVKNTDRNCLREFQMTVSDMKQLPYSELTDRQKEFLKYYDIEMPVGTGDCIMNKICRRFEDEFDGFVKKKNIDSEYDYSIMMSSASYTSTQYYSVKKLYENYNKTISNYIVFSKSEKINDSDVKDYYTFLRDVYHKDCSKICPNEETLCNIILDMCYKKESTKSFAWGLCKEQIILNLLENNNNVISFPVLDPYGDIEFGGNTYKLKFKVLEEEEECL